MNDNPTHDDTPSGHAPDVCTCQNPECGGELTADTIGRDSEGEDDGSGNTLFCTSCSSRDVRLVEMKHPLFNAENFEPAEHINMQQVPMRTEAGHKVRAAFLYPADGVADYISYYDKLQGRS